MEFSAAIREMCAVYGIDIEDSYRALQLDVRLGGAAGQRMVSMAVDDVRRSNVESRRELHPERLGTTGRRYRSVDPEAPRLTPGELRVLTLMASSHGRNHEIAAQLHVTTHTIATHVKSILVKLGVHNRTHAVAIGIRTGLIQPPAR